MYVCSCFGITEKQVREHADSGACTPRQIASASKAGTDCGSCVRRIQSLLGRGAVCPRRELLKEPVRAETVRVESVRAEPVRLEAVRPEPVRVEAAPAA
ncbi:(2Fe-2S)-binding protein [Streptomyces sp. NPDC006638]|uniref:(2Fe-2S)-binding protein n=1 Tax=Streptomyces sp. NPDC006638 TaxID=3157183 RepID=UPI0033B0CE55